MVNIKRRKWPGYIRLAIAAAASGIAGLLIWIFGAMFVDPSQNAELHDLMPAIGSSIMSVCSLMFMVVAVLTAIDTVRTGTFNWSHLFCLLIAGCTTAVAGVLGAYPR